MTAKRLFDQPVLVYYKKSAHTIYALEKQNPLFNPNNPLTKKEIKRFKKTHDVHYASLARVESFLKEAGIPYDKYARGQQVDFSAYRFVVSIGGDGTFLEAARHVKKQIILGVNSDPLWSVGRFCAADADTLPGILQQLKSHKLKPGCYQRIRIKSRHFGAVNILNDVLVCHRNPAAMSRYALHIGQIREEQTSSGIWISTAAGSSGAMLSAGGSVLDYESKIFQYKCRELYRRPGVKYTLQGGVLEDTQNMKITSLMRDGVLYMDGAHLNYPFTMGQTVKIEFSPYPLHLIVREDGRGST